MHLHSDQQKYAAAGMPSLVATRHRHSAGDSFPHQQPPHTKFSDNQQQMGLTPHFQSMATYNSHQPPAHRMNVHASTFFNNNSSNNNRNWPSSSSSSSAAAAHQSHLQHHHHHSLMVGDGGSSGIDGHSNNGLASPKIMNGPMMGSMYLNYSRQQRFLSNDSSGGRSSYPSSCHGGPLPYPFQQQQHPQHHHQLHNSSIQSSVGLNTTGDSGFSSSLSYDADNHNASGGSSSNSSYGSVSGYPASGASSSASSSAADESVTLQISNIDTSIEDRALKNYLIGKLKPITPILSFTYEGLSMVKIRLPSLHHAKLVVAFLHRKKIRHKRISVAYSSTLEPSTLRCQVAGLLKDIPNYNVSMYKFREIFQSRFKTSISVMDLYEMKDVCTITENTSDEKIISLRPELINSIENSELLGCLQLSVPYCSDHFKSGHRGWAELEIEPLPNVLMAVAEVRSIIYSLLKNHKGDIPIASLVYCIEAVVNVRVERNEKGVNLEHLISCVNGVQIVGNKFGIKILSWLGKDAHTTAPQQHSNVPALTYGNGNSFEDMKSMQQYSKFANMTEPFGQISREIIELIKMSPKSMMKFSRFIPAYHNHFGKQCRVADYGYTKLIELFEALTDVVQVMGDGENRQITLTHKCQVRCFTSDLLRLLRSQSRKCVMMSHVESMFGAHMGRKFDVTDYGVCKLEDIMESLIRNNVVQVEADATCDDMIVSIPKRRQSHTEMQKTCVFAGEVVDLLKNSSQFSISFEKIACSYHYIFGYQCRLNDYGFLKLTDLMEAITGVVEIEISGNEDRKVCLSPKVAQRVFSEQLRDLTKLMTGSSTTPMSLGALLYMHKKQYGFQMQPQSLGLGFSWIPAMSNLPFVELTPSSTSEGAIVVCHHDDPKFLFNSYGACRIILESGLRLMPMSSFINAFFGRFAQILSETTIKTMAHAVLIITQNGTKSVCISPLLLFVLRIVSVLETMNIVTIADLKTCLNLGITDCFRFGYPNFNSLIASFSDVFHFSAGVAEQSEVALNRQSILVQNGVQSFFRGSADIAGPGREIVHSVPPPPPPFQPWLSTEPNPPAAIESAPRPPRKILPAKPEVVEPDVICTARSFDDRQSVGPAQRPLEPPGFQPICKVNQERSVAKSHVNESELEPFYCDPKWAAPEEVDVSAKKSRLPLYERKPRESWNPIESVKPAPEAVSVPPWTPFWGSSFRSQQPSSATSSNNVPFWMDPVWKHESPVKKPIEIEIPELIIHDSIPDLSSPAAMARILQNHPDLLNNPTTSCAATEIKSEQIIVDY